MVPPQRIPFAIDSSGVIRSVREVPNGLACECRCPECNTRVIARNAGTKVMPHFAHESRAECWNALEAALWMMALRLLNEPSAVLYCPPAGAVHREFPNPRQYVMPEDLAAFQSRDWLLEGKARNVIDAHTVVPSLKEACSQPDFRCRDLSVYFLHSKRNWEQVRMPDGLEGPVLAIDLRHYAKKWIDLCSDRPEDQLDAKTDTSALRHWLAAGVDGREWLVEPDFSEEKAEWARLSMTSPEEVHKAWERLTELNRIKGREVCKSPAEYRKQVLQALALHDYAEPKPASEDQQIATTTLTCTQCGEPSVLMIGGWRHRGPYAGRRLVCCSAEPYAHPADLVPLPPSQQATDEDED